MQIFLSSTQLSSSCNGCVCVCVCTCGSVCFYMRANVNIAYSRARVVYFCKEDKEKKKKEKSEKNTKATTTTTNY